MASSILWIPIAWDLCSPLLPMDALFVMWIHKFLRGEGLQRVQEVALPWHPQGRRQIDRAETANMAAGRQQEADASRQAKWTESSKLCVCGPPSSWFFLVKLNAAFDHSYSFL
jgi:hypothetical protein